MAASPGPRILRGVVAAGALVDAVAPWPAAARFVTLGERMEGARESTVMSALHIGHYIVISEVFNAIGSTKNSTSFLLRINQASTSST